MDYITLALTIKEEGTDYKEFNELVNLLDNSDNVVACSLSPLVDSFPIYTIEENTYEGDMDKLIKAFDSIKGIDTDFTFTDKMYGCTCTVKTFSDSNIILVKEVSEVGHVSLEVVDLDKPKE